MNLFPPVSAKRFAECEHGEFISLQLNDGFYSGLCVVDEVGKKELLLLAPSTADKIFSLLEMGPSTAVKSYGTDWTLTTSSPMENPRQAFQERGAIVHSTEGTFIVCVGTRGGFTDPGMCRLDEPGIYIDTGMPPASFADAAWEISVFDPTTRSSLTLASKA